MDALHPPQALEVPQPLHALEALQPPERSSVPWPLHHAEEALQSYQQGVSVLMALYSTVRQLPVDEQAWLLDPMITIKEGLQAMCQTACQLAMKDCASALTDGRTGAASASLLEGTARSLARLQQWLCYCKGTLLQEAVINLAAGALSQGPHGAPAHSNCGQCSRQSGDVLHVDIRSVLAVRRAARLHELALCILAFPDQLCRLTEGHTCLAEKTAALPIYHALKLWNEDVATILHSLACPTTPESSMSGQPSWVCSNTSTAAANVVCSVHMPTNTPANCSPRPLYPRSEAMQPHQLRQQYAAALGLPYADSVSRAAARQAHADGDARDAPSQTHADGGSAPAQGVGWQQPPPALVAQEHQTGLSAVENGQSHRQPQQVSSAQNQQVVSVPLRSNSNLPHADGHGSSKSVTTTDSSGNGALGVMPGTLTEVSIPVAGGGGDLGSTSAVLGSSVDGGGTAPLGRDTTTHVVADLVTCSASVEEQVRSTRAGRPVALLSHVPGQEDHVEAVHSSGAVPSSTSGTATSTVTCIDHDTVATHEAANANVIHAVACASTVRDNNTLSSYETVGSSLVVHMGSKDACCCKCVGANESETGTACAVLGGCNGNMACHPVATLHACYGDMAAHPSRCILLLWKQLCYMFNRQQSLMQLVLVILQLADEFAAWQRQALEGLHGLQLDGMMEP